LPALLLKEEGMLSTFDGKKQSARKVDEFLTIAIDLAYQRFGGESASKHSAFIGSVVVALTVDFLGQGIDDRLLGIANIHSDIADALNDDADAEREAIRHRLDAQDCDQLKWLFDKAQPNMSEVEHHQMQAFIQRLSGL
jgi:hypothetical protein